MRPVDLASQTLAHFEVAAAQDRVHFPLLAVLDGDEPQAGVVHVGLGGVDVGVVVLPDHLVEFIQNEVRCLDLHGEKLTAVDVEDLSPVAGGTVAHAALAVLGGELAERGAKAGVGELFAILPVLPDLEESGGRDGDAFEGCDGGHVEALAFDHDVLVQLERVERTVEGLQAPHGVDGEQLLDVNELEPRRDAQLARGRPLAAVDREAVAKELLQHRRRIAVWCDAYVAVLDGSSHPGAPAHVPSGRCQEVAQVVEALHVRVARQQEHVLHALVGFDQGAQVATESRPTCLGLFFCGLFSDDHAAGGHAVGIQPEGLLKIGVGVEHTRAGQAKILPDIITAPMCKRGEKQLSVFPAACASHLGV